MKSTLTAIINRECRHLTDEALRLHQVILIKKRIDGTVDQEHLGGGFLSAHGKQGPGLSYVVSLDQLRKELERGFAGNPARRYFIESKDLAIFEAKAFGDLGHNLVIFADSRGNVA